MSMVRAILISTSPVSILLGHPSKTDTEEEADETFLNEKNHRGAALFFLLPFIPLTTK